MPLKSPSIRRTNTKEIDSEDENFLYNKKEDEENEAHNLKDKHTVFQSLKSWDNLNIISVCIMIIAIGIIAYIGIDECKRCFIEIRELQTNIVNNNKDVSNTKISQSAIRSYWVYLRKKDDSHLKHVYRVLNSMGYSNDATNENWDLLWAHDYPFIAEYEKMRKLKPHQKVNHVPGCGYITTKVELSTSDLKYILPAFRLPNDKEKFINFTTKYPKKKFVLKHNEHRHIQVKSKDEISLDSNGSFVQEFLDNPLLISGHMFDIGVYTIITSIDPLRIYIYNGDVLLRFCPETFKPFDPLNLDKYVVGDDYLPIWEVPKIQYWYKKLGYGMRDSLNAYLADDGRDGSVIWKQIEEAIAIAIHSKAQLILNVTKRFPSKRNFFELMRFDFLVDHKLNVYLLEANMSPNLSSAHFQPNQLLYEQVLFNLFGLVGLGDRIHKSQTKRALYDREMETSEKNILVMPNTCSNAMCRNNCDILDCQLCKACLNANKEFERDVYDAHKEHLNRGDCKRIFPPTLAPFKKLPNNVLTFSKHDQLMHLWFQEKCNMDQTYC